MDDTLAVGTAIAEPGERADGWIEATDLPTGGTERLPVIVVNGAADGPVLWVTGGVHGDEATGVAVAQDAAASVDDASAELAGAVVSVPVVNPAGLRRTERTSYYGGDDPNRYFPDTERGDSRPPETQERIDARLFDLLAESADLLVDCHTAQAGSMPFTIRDRVLYGQERTETEAAALAADLDRLASALDLPVLTEYPAEEYVEQSLQRSTAGAALNTAGIPAVTAELGGHRVVEEDARTAGVAGIVAAAVEFGLLDSPPAGVADAGDGVPDAPVEYAVRRSVGPRVEEAGLVRHRVAVGDTVDAGEVVAEVVTPHGDVVEAVESERDGYVIARSEGLAAYEGQAVASMAVRDDGDVVVPRDAAEE
ncbi:succinylglutamate desuccinylase/aspartoacylase family protein [Halobaculum halobium]|uniref:Succinylglutamate desuccinylase/aspartoacylase family protein n=1 Tax=Halobaculum halobium TaxID=3032281 RepID=A0ABD5TCM5_9EURY|nr:succinylglutamate desuccinylase/aspartoacylase family protein [Halobaculum sp. SYNS20]